MRDARDIVERLRRQYGNPADFDHVIRHMLADFLADYDPKTRAITMRAIFGDD